MCSQKHSRILRLSIYLSGNDSIGTSITSVQATSSVSPPGTLANHPSLGAIQPSSIVSSALKDPEASPVNADLVTRNSILDFHYHRAQVKVGSIPWSDVIREEVTLIKNNKPLIITGKFYEMT